MHRLVEYAFGLKKTVDQLPFDQIETIIHSLHQARLRGRQVFILGNGGSATTATHLACDLGKNTVTSTLPRYRVLALTDNMALFSAIANDFSYEDVFAEQLVNLVQPGDLVIAISASGNSRNVLKAVAVAHQHQAITIGWSGFDGGQLATLVDLPIVIRNDCIEQVEDIHLMLAHMVTVGVRNLGTQPIMTNGILSEVRRVLNGNGHD